MKRLCKRLAIYGLLGVLTTIVIAWSFALQTSVRGAPRFALGNGTSSFGYNSPENGVVWLLGRNISTGTIEQNIGRALPGDDNIAEVRVDRILQRHEIPWWSIMRQRSAPEQLPQRCIEQGFGWPLVCLIQRHQLDTSTSRMQSTTALDIPREWQRFGRARHLPLQPLWPAFIASSALYGWLWFSVIAFPALVNRRIRTFRGCCANCGYSRRAAASDRCPECGAITTR